MFAKIKVLRSFFDGELQKPFTEGTEDEASPAKAKELAEAGLVEIISMPTVKKAVPAPVVETAEMPEANVEKAVKRSTRKRKK